MSLFDSLPEVSRGGFTSLPEWHAFCAEEEMPVEARLGIRSTWARKLRNDPAGFNGLRYAHLGTIYVDTPRFETLRQNFANIVFLNYGQSSLKDPILVDSLEGNYGKSHFVARILRDYRARAYARGRRFPVPEGENNLHEPTIYATCDATARHSRGDEAILDYLLAPWKGHLVGQLPGLIKRHVLRLDTSVIVIDDIQELRRWRLSDEEMAGHLKFLMSLLPVTMILVGWDLVGNKILVEGDDGIYRLSRKFTRGGESTIGDVIGSTSSTEGRVTRFFIPGYDLDTEESRPLLRAKRGMLSSPKMSSYIWERTSGVIGSVEKLLTRGTLAMIQSGDEYLDDKLLEPVPIDEAADLKRPAAKARLKELHRELAEARKNGASARA